jgi:hypothetical protein
MRDMATLAKNCKSTVIPGLRYRNAMAMIEWLCRAFRFEKQAVYAGPDGVVMHSQLTFGNGMIMVGSVDNRTPGSNMLKQPDEIGGAETQTPYLSCIRHRCNLRQRQGRRREDVDRSRRKGLWGQGISPATIPRDTFGMLEPSILGNTNRHERATALGDLKTPRRNLISWPNPNL